MDGVAGLVVMVTRHAGCQSVDKLLWLSWLPFRSSQALIWNGLNGLKLEPNVSVLRAMNLCIISCNVCVLLKYCLKGAGSKVLIIARYATNVHAFECENRIAGFSRPYEPHADVRHFFGASFIHKTLLP